MKRILIIVAIFVMAFSFDNEQTLAQSTGLVAYYPFSGNANDSSGNGHHGTVNGAILTTDRLGDADHAYSFDGVHKDYNIQCTNPVSGGIFSVAICCLSHLTLQP